MAVNNVAELLDSLLDPISGPLVDEKVADFDTVAAMLRRPDVQAFIAKQLTVPPKVFHNTKWAGEGIGGFGDYRVVVRSARKAPGLDGRYIQILDDSDGMGISFTVVQTAKLIELLLTAHERARRE